MRDLAALFLTAALVAPALLSLPQRRIALSNSTTGTAPPSDLGVVAQSASYDPAKNEIAIRFYNSTRHDVTAYNYSLKIDYADGTSNLEDRSSELAVDPTYEGFFLHAGSTRDEKLYDPQPKQVTRVVGVVDVVAYDDGTAEVANEAAFNRLVEDRKAQVVARQKVNELLKQSFSAESPGEYALNKLNELRKTYVDKGLRRDVQDAAMLDQLHMTIQNLSQFGPLTSDRLHEYIKQRDEGLPAMKFHSELRRIN
jgi:hypothetical protein